VPLDSQLDPLAVEIGQYTHDPLGFVLACFPWGEPGQLADKTGPEKWQAIVLTEIGKGLKASDDVIREAVASGHGVGKSALVSWIILWALFTCVNARVAVTANTEPQLRTKTWPELLKWFRMCVGREWFTATATTVFRSDPDYRETWKADALTWSENNTEAFAGLHNEGNRIVLIFDEASAIADRVWEVAEGALTDANTEIVWCAFGNPTRNTGRFRECFGRYQHRWNRQQVDSRSVSFTNKAQLEQWAADYGDDSDFMRVRVKGEFPRAGAAQFISSEAVEEARKRTPSHIETDPVVIGVDPARFGDDRSVIYIRRGRDAKSIPPVIRRGVDNMALAGLVAELATKHLADAVNIDAGAGSGVIDRCRQLNVKNVHEIPFGGKPEGFTPEGGLPLFHDRAAEMWGRMRDWLPGASIHDDPEVAADLTGREYGYDAKNAIQLEKKEDMKKRGLASPDIADALALTFAVPVQPRNDKPPDFSRLKKGII
jgi:hypothetical protein